MSIGTPVDIGGNTSTSSPSTLAITVGAGGVPQNARIIVGMATNHASVPGSISVADSKGNTYVKDEALSDGSNNTAIVFSANASTALVNGDTITVTWGTTTSRVAIRAAYSTGLATSSALDAHNNINQAANTTLTGAAVTTVTADVLLIGIFGISLGATASTGFTAAGGATAMTESNIGAGSINRAMAWEYRILSATATSTPTASQSASKAYEGLTVAYKIAVSGVTLPTVTSAGTGATSCPTGELHKTFPAVTSAGTGAASSASGMLDKLFPSVFSHGVGGASAHAIDPNLHLPTVTAAGVGAATSSAGHLRKLFPTVTAAGVGGAHAGTFKHLPVVVSAGHATASSSGLKKLLPQVAAHGVGAVHRGVLRGPYALPSVLSQGSAVRGSSSGPGTHASSLTILSDPIPPPVIAAYISQEIPGLEAKIVYNGLVLNDLSQIESYRLTAIDGDFDADVRDSREQNADRHGETAYPSLYGGRTIALTGTMFALSIRRLREMQQALRSAFIDMKDFDLIFQTNDPTHGSDLKIACRKSVALVGTESQQNEMMTRDFVVTLRAPDPRYLSFVERQRTIDANSTSIVIPNIGNFNSDVVLRLNGPMIDPVIQSSTNDQTISLQGTINEGEWIEIDTLHRTIVDENGANQFSLLAQHGDGSPIAPDWIELIPGDNTIALTAVDRPPPATMDIKWRDSWL